MGKFLKLYRNPLTQVKGALNIGLTFMLLGCVAIIVGSAMVRWAKVLSRPKAV